MTQVPPTKIPWADRVAGDYGRGRPLALMFDYDGTLTPIARHPSLARLVPRAREQLRRLSALPEVRVGVISGRPLAELRALVGLDGCYYAGSGGLEIDLIGAERRFPEADAIGRLLDALQDQLSTHLKRYPGTWLERKPGAFAIHYRGLLPLAATCFRLEMADILSAAEGLRFRVVSEAIEVTPAGGWDTGTAVLSILEHTAAAFAAHPLAVYFGDSSNGSEGMAVAAQIGGVAVGVGPPAPPGAAQRLPDPSALLACLDELIARLVAERGLPASTAGDSPPPRAAPDRAAGASGPTAEPAGAGVLLLDADAAARGELAAGLTALGWRVWQADTSERAAELVSEHGEAIHVALVDLQLPGLLGARTQAELGQRRPGLVRGFLSASVSPYTAAAFGRLSSLPLFVKPLSPRALSTTLRAMLARSPHAASHQ